MQNAIKEQTVFQFLHSTVGCAHLVLWVYILIAKQKGFVVDAP